MLVRLANLTKNEGLRESLLSTDQVLGVLMISGSVILVLMVVTFHKYPRLLLALMVLSLSFGGVGWKPLHDIAIIWKYLGVVFFAAYAAQSLYKNFWRFVAIPFIRLILAWLVWMAVVCIFIGGRQDDFWYLGNEIAFLAGFTITWLYAFNKNYDLKEFYYLISWLALAVIAMQLVSPLVMDSVLVSGRFVSFYGRATGFSMKIAPLVIVLFWRAMEDKDPRIATIFSVAALIGFALVLLSGSRSPSAATLMGVGILWWYFRSRLLFVMLFLAVLTVAGQLVLSAGDSGIISDLLGRVESVNSEEDGRSSIWAAYIEVAARSPIYGYAPSGKSFAIVGGALGEFLESRGTEVKTAGVHNAYLGIALRFGLVGLGLFLAIIVSALIRARQVLFSKLIPAAEKRIYILPAALIAVIVFTCFFEDRIPGNGKGEIEQFLLYASIAICQFYGSRLINVYERTDSKAKLIKTVDDFNVLPQSTAVT